MMKKLLYTAIFNTLIAGLLTLVGFGSSFGTTWMFSQCIGLTICGCVIGAFHIFQPQQLFHQVLTAIIAVAAGALIGLTIATLLLWLVEKDASLKDRFTFQVLAISILFGLVITYFFHTKQSLAVTKDMINQERIKRLSSEKQILEADLKRLQAQVEPHFLFNTLSHIVSLIDTDPAKAKAMQLDFIRYLRGSLSVTRDRSTTLGEEFERLRAYLDIYKIRMGDRLQYDLHIPESLTHYCLAPMLLQPLVENAVIHGLEPLMQGGRISVRAQAENDLLKLVVADTGCGMADNQRTGTGIGNVKARINSLFGPRGRLSIEENRPSGLRAVIEVPFSEERQDNVK